MRVTTQMLNETARKTGIPINQNNLLNYLNNAGESSNTLLDSLKKNSKVSAGTVEKYKQLEDTAEKLSDAAEKLTASGEKSLFDKVRESGEKEELYAGVESFLDRYNSTLNALDKIVSPLNMYYSQMLQDAAEENKEALENIGISVGKNGRLSLDSEKLKNASVDDMEKVLGSSGTLSTKAAFIADRISNNAQANAQSASSQYDISGNLFSQISSKYDFWA